MTVLHSTHAHGGDKTARLFLEIVKSRRDWVPCGVLTCCRLMSSHMHGHHSSILFATVRENSDVYLKLLGMMFVMLKY